MPKVTVLLPSRNEEDSIRQVVQCIDAGLSKVLSPNDCILLNIDGSTDETPAVFASQKTQCRKSSLKIEGGKGAKIIAGIQQSLKDTDIFLMLDTDLTSLEEKWVGEFLQPIIQEQAMFVAPAYRRNRYEGNTTNHFVWPVYSTLFGDKLSQPIGGDFAFRAEVAQKAVDTLPVESADKYGIDALLTWTALNADLAIREIGLPRKVHKPSFPKIEGMFRDVATTVSDLLLRSESEFHVEQGPKGHQFRIDDEYVKRPSHAEVKKVKARAQALAKECEAAFSTLGRESTAEAIKVGSVSSDEWADLLAEFVTKSSSGDGEPRDWVSILTLAFLVRVVTYFNEIESLPSPEVERILLAQRDKFIVNVLTKEHNHG